MKKYLSIALLFILLCSLAGCKQEQTGENVQTIQTQPVEKEPAQQPQPEPVPEPEPIPEPEPEPDPVPAPEPKPEPEPVKTQTTQ